MEPFRVICETCGARLKVRSEEVIGQIHACPKCESMVQIVPPPGWGAVAAGMSHEVLPALPVTDFGRLSPGKATLAESVEFPAPDLATSDFVMPAAEESASAEPVLPVAASSSSWILWGVSGAALLVIGGAVAAFWPDGETEPDNLQPTPQAMAVAAADRESRESAEPAKDAPPPEQSRHADAAPVVDEPDVQSTAAESSPPPRPESPPMDDQNTAAGAHAVTEPVVPTLPPPVATAEPAHTDQPDAAQPSPKPVMKLDPLNFDASEFTLAPNAVGNVTPAAGSIPPTAEGVAERTADDSVAGAEESVPDKKVDHTLSFRLGPMLSGVPRPQGAAAPLSLHVGSLDVADMPLVQFADTISEMTNVRLTIDPVALELVGIAARQPITAKAANTTAEKLLQDGLGKNRLAFVDDRGNVLIVPAGGERRRAIDYDVSDLVDKDGGKQLASLIQQFVAPESWNAGGGGVEVQGTKLHVDHTQNIRHQVLIFCERLRLVRGLPLRSRYPAALLSVEPAYQETAPKLGHKATFTFMPWSRLADVVRHWQDESGVTILVDWGALSDVELSPSSLVACAAVDRTWTDIVDGALEPIGLAWWPVNGGTIQITSREAVEDLQRIEFYAVPNKLSEQFRDSKAFVASLHDELSKQEGNSNKQPVITVDDASGRLIVLGSPFVHRILSERFTH